MPVSVNDLKIIATRGGGMILDSKKISANDLKIIATRASTTRAHIILKNPDVISTNDLKIIGTRSKGCVVFDFYDI